MAWRIEISETARKQLSKLDKGVQKGILRFLRERIATDEDPKRFGAPLRRDLTGLWKYRIGAYRLVCDIQGDRLMVLVLRMGHRREVYENAKRAGHPTKSHP